MWVTGSNREGFTDPLVKIENYSRPGVSVYRREICLSKKRHGDTGVDNSPDY